MKKGPERGLRSALNARDSTLWVAHQDFRRHRLFMRHPQGLYVTAQTGCRRRWRAYIRLQAAYIGLQTGCDTSHPAHSRMQALFGGAQPAYTALQATYIVLQAAYIVLQAGCKVTHSAKSPM